jgi:DNA polymerase-2
MTPARGFILQPTYRIESGRPVVHLYGKLDTGATFLVRDDRALPYFFIGQGDRERALALGARPLTATGQRTLRGEPVLRVELPTPLEVPALRERLGAHAILVYEADLQFALRYLIDRGIRGAMSICGPATQEPLIAQVFARPELQPARCAPPLSVLSLDIETDPKAQRLLSVALYGCGAAEVLLLTPPGYCCPPGATPCATQEELLRRFQSRVRELDPDVLIGWNVIDFDLAVLARLAAGHRMELELGRGPGALRVQPSRSRWASSRASLPGRVVLDGIQLLRSAFIRMDEYSLDFVARQVLGEGKLMTGHERAEDILQAFLHDRPRFCAYNLTDARLVDEIITKLRLIELSVERSLLTGMPIDRVAASIASFDYLYLSELRHRGLVAPTVGDAEEAVEPTQGGHVLDPEPGLYRNILVFDFKSLYPSIMRTFLIDPVGYVKAPEPQQDPAALIKAPSGAAFRRQPGILPALLDDLFPRREQAKREGDTVKSHAIKILMNSCYGVLGTPACRFYNADIANAITSFGRELLLWSKARIESYGHPVRYGDTDSLFVESGTADAAQAREVGCSLVARLNRDLAEHVRATWQVTSKLELAFDRLYLRLLLPRMRTGLGGARKRYAGLVQQGPPESPLRRVVFTGMEAVRSDWTELARQVQRELYARLFSDQPVIDYLKQVGSDLRKGRIEPRLLVYRKALRKDLTDYTSTTPPHVAAARKLQGRPGRQIAYVMTQAGPEPAAELKSPIDHEHYVQKQLRPVAEPVLQLLPVPLSFAEIMGEGAQLDLFAPPGPQR